MDDREFLDALDRVDQQITSRPEGVGDDLRQVCDEYRRLRPTIQGLAGAIAFIPGIGKKVSRMLDFLMRLADAACADDPERAGG